MTTINFDRIKLKALKKKYTEAVKDNKETFIFEGNEFLVSYAKYVIEYLENKLSCEESLK
jgi:hypothetical protein